MLPDSAEFPRISYLDVSQGRQLFHGRRDSQKASGIDVRKREIGGLIRHNSKKASEVSSGNPEKGVSVHRTRAELLKVSGAPESKWNPPIGKPKNSGKCRPGPSGSPEIPESVDPPSGLPLEFLDLLCLTQEPNVAFSGEHKEQVCSLYRSP